MSDKLKTKLKNTGLALPFLVGLVILFIPGELSWPVGLSILVMVSLLYLIIFGRHQAMATRVRWGFIGGFTLLAVLISSAVLLYFQVGPGSAYLVARGLALAVGIVVSLVITWIFFIAVIYVSSVYVLTLESEENISRWNAFRSLYTLIRNTQYDWVMVKDGEAKIIKEKSGVKKWSGLGKIFVTPGHAVILQKKTEITRICGAGTYLKDRDEEVREVFVSSQFAPLTMENVITRDQIPLTLKVGVSFKFVSAKDTEAKGVIKDNWNLFAVDEATLRKSAGSSGGGWKKGPAGVAEGNLRDQIMTYDLDELFVIHSKDRDSAWVNNRQIKKIEDAVKEATNQFAQSKGLEVTLVDIQEISLPDGAKEAIYTRIKSKAEAEAIQRIEEKRNDARGQLVTRILDSIAERTDDNRIGQVELELATVFAQLTRRALTDDVLGHQYVEILRKLAEGDATKIFNASPSVSAMEPEYLRLPDNRKKNGKANNE